MEKQSRRGLLKNAAKVALKVSVFLKNIDDYDRMNVIYKACNWGPIPPARTVIAPARIPYNPLFEIDCIAYI